MRSPWGSIPLLLVSASLKLSAVGIQNNKVRHIYITVSTVRPHCLFDDELVGGNYAGDKARAALSNLASADQPLRV
jgi:hypothetical protein